MTAASLDRDTLGAALTSQGQLKETLDRKAVSQRPGQWAQRSRRCPRVALEARIEPGACSRQVQQRSASGPLGLLGSLQKHRYRPLACATGRPAGVSQLAREPRALGIAGTCHHRIAASFLEPAHGFTQREEPTRSSRDPRRIRAPESRSDAQLARSGPRDRIPEMQGAGKTGSPGDEAPVVLLVHTPAAEAGARPGSSAVLLFSQNILYLFSSLNLEP